MTGGVFIGLGSNLGNRGEHIRAALGELEEAGDIRVLRCSGLHETEPVGGPPGQRRYLNAVAELETDLSPRELLDRLLIIEQGHGRQRGVVNGPRTLDLDLLLYREHVIDEPDLVVPHPRMWERPFVMLPLEEICDPEFLENRPATFQTEPPARASGRAERPERPQEPRAPARADQSSLTEPCQLTIPKVAARGD